MKHEEVMSEAKKEGTARRKEKHLTYPRATWIIGGMFIIVAAIWLPEGPLQTYARYTTVQKVAQARAPVPATAADTSGGCTHYHPCTLTVDSVGSTETVRFGGQQGGQLVCLEDSFWSHVRDVGYWVSYLGGPERQYLCTKEQVASGTCDIGFFDAFRFVPKPGTPLPRYWFVPYGSKQC